MAPTTTAFVRSIEAFVDRHGIDLVSFEKRQRKDDVTQSICGVLLGEAVLYVGAGEGANIRTQRRRSARTGKTYPWLPEGSAMVNYDYFYCVDEDFGPFFTHLEEHFTSIDESLDWHGAFPFLREPRATRSAPRNPGSPNGGIHLLSFSSDGRARKVRQGLREAWNRK